MGCRRALQLAIVMGSCIAADYIWAPCWPMISRDGCHMVCTQAGASLWNGSVLCRWWAERRGLAMLSTSARLRIDPQNPVSSGSSSQLLEQDKRVVFKRDGVAGVFRVGAEAHAIKSRGMYVTIHVGGLRGDAPLLQQLAGFDRVHLCRHRTCTEEGRPLHSSKYLSQRFMNKCCFAGCNRLGHASTKGVRSYVEHDGEVKPQKTSRSRPREGRSLQDVKGILAEIKNALPPLPGPLPELVACRTRTSRSPGTVPWPRSGCWISADR